MHWDGSVPDSTHVQPEDTHGKAPESDIVGQSGVCRLLTSAAVGQGVAIVAELTAGAGRAFGVAQALETLAASGVT